ncbi:hypothetical protein [Oscillatoria sp. FACHB-1407]|uniref:hypothetical protein n=1 Tax=Oscillatoria sp. FACHB-1407 TaxID=2692847 RepID=UPI0035CCF26F
MVDPLFWLGLSILFVAVSLTAVLVAALPALRELARAARSAEKLFDTLSRELPPTLEAIRLTGMEISDLTDDVSEGVQSAGRVVKQFDDSLRGVKKQAKKAQLTTRSLVVGFKAAWRAFKRPNSRRPPERLPQSERSPLNDASYPLYNASTAREFYAEESFVDLTEASPDYDSLDYDSPDYDSSDYDLPDYASPDYHSSGLTDEDEYYPLEQTGDPNNPATHQHRVEETEA